MNSPAEVVLSTVDPGDAIRGSISLPMASHPAHGPPEFHAAAELIRFGEERARPSMATLDFPARRGSPRPGLRRDGDSPAIARADLDSPEPADTRAIPVGGRTFPSFLPPVLPLGRRIPRGMPGTPPSAGGHRDVRHCRRREGLREPRVLIPGAHLAPTLFYFYLC